MYVCVCARRAFYKEIGRLFVTAVADAAAPVATIQPRACKKNCQLCIALHSKHIHLYAIVAHFFALPFARISFRSIVVSATFQPCATKLTFA